jgi:hypothetical protein
MGVEYLDCAFTVLLDLSHHFGNHSFVLLGLVTNVQYLDWVQGTSGIDYCATDLGHLDRFFQKSHLELMQIQPIPGSPEFPSLG